MKPLKSTPIPDEVPARRYWPARRAILRILMPVLRLLYGFRVVGDPTMCSAPGPFVVVCNHVHTLDCVMVSKAFEQKRQWVLSLPSNLELPVAGAIVRVMGGIPVPDRPAGYRVLYRRLEEVFARGEFFQVYPEGELLPGCRTLRPFHPGAFLLQGSLETKTFPTVLLLEFASQLLGFHLLSGVGDCQVISLSGQTPGDPFPNAPAGSCHHRFFSFHIVLLLSVTSLKGPLSISRRTRGEHPHCTAAFPAVRSSLPWGTPPAFLAPD